MMRIIIKKNNDIYKLREELLDFDIRWDSKNQTYNNRYEISLDTYNAAIWFCEKHEFAYEIKEINFKDDYSRIVSQYLLKEIDKNVYGIQNRADLIFSYIISIYSNVEQDIINVVDNTKGQHFSYRTKIQDTSNQIMDIHKIFSNNISRLKDENKNFDTDTFIVMMNSLLSEFTNESEIYGKIKKFKFHTISKLNENSFLCNGVKGFYPETKFYLVKGKIKSTFNNNFLDNFQENKVWAFLYYNHDRVGIEKKLTLQDLFVGYKIPVQINTFETKMEISKVKWNDGSIKVEVFDGKTKYKINRTYNKDELWAMVISNR